MRNMLLLGGAAIPSLVLATSAAAQAVYTDSSAFIAGTSPATYNFSFADPDESITSPFVFGPATFSGDFVGYNDGRYGTGISYLGDFASDLTVTTGAESIGFFLADYDGIETINYSVDGVSGSIGLPARPGSTFLGFSGLSGNSTITLSANQDELDTLGFLASDISAVPEPRSWAIMLLGLGLVGFAMRRRPLKSWAALSEARKL